MSRKNSEIVAAVLLFSVAAALFVSGYVTRAHTWLWAGVIALLFTKGARSLLQFQRGQRGFPVSAKESYLVMAAYLVPFILFLLSVVSGEGSVGLLAAPVVLSFALAFGIAARRTHLAR